MSVTLSNEIDSGMEVVDRAVAVVAGVTIAASGGCFSQTSDLGVVGVDGIGIESTLVVKILSVVRGGEGGVTLSTLLLDADALSSSPLLSPL